VKQALAGCVVGGPFPVLVFACRWRAAFSASQQFKDSGGPGFVPAGRTVEFPTVAARF